jgi:hypothetical protein
MRVQPLLSVAQERQVGLRASTPGRAFQPVEVFHLELMAGRRRVRQALLRLLWYQADEEFERQEFALEGCHLELGFHHSGRSAGTGLSNFGRRFFCRIDIDEIARLPTSY